MPRRKKLDVEEQIADVNLDELTLDIAEELDDLESPDYKPVVFVRAMVGNRKQIQRSRIGLANQVRAIESGLTRATKSHKDNLVFLLKQYKENEERVNEILRELAQDIPIVQVMTKIKGIGPIMAIQLYAYVDIRRAASISGLWRRCGQGVASDGKRDRLTKGERLPYSKDLKALMYNIAVGFLRSGSPYRKIYDDAREYYENRETPDNLKRLGLEREPWKPIHQHYASLRKMVKVYLSHLWLVWREMEGLPISEPYAMAHLDHVHFIPPAEFGWYDEDK